jgi:hypothetical protein
MDKQHFEAMQVERFRRAAARELEHERINTRLRRRIWGAALLFVLGSAGIGGCLVRTSAPAQQAATGDDAPEGPPEVFVTDGADAGAIARPIRKERIPGQKAPPCKPRTQVEVLGACWVRTDVRPPCDELYEHNGRCYAPVMEAPPPPVGIDP